MEKNSQVTIMPSNRRTRGLCHRVALYVVMATAALLAACGGGGNSSNSTGGTASLVILSPTAPRIVTGRVLSASTGDAVANAQVTLQGTTITTDATGNYTFNDVVLDDRVLISFRANGYASTTQVAFRPATQILTVNVGLLPIATTQQIDPTTGGTVTATDSPAQVVLQANSMVRVDGNPISGNVTVDLTPIPVAVNSNWVSGDYTAINSGQVVMIESFGAITASLKDTQGAQVDLASGQTATIRIPVSSRAASVPATAPLFYFDESTARWVEEGTATLVGTGSTAYYEGNVTHFRTWTVGQYPQTIQVTGCLADGSGVHVANGIIMSDGIDYSATSGVRTDSNGNFSIPIRSGGRATITGQMNGSTTNTVNAGPSTTSIDLGTSCLTLPTGSSGIKVKLTWGTNPLDLDSHIFVPDGSHVYYGAPGSLTNAPYLNLDVDDVTSYGPEIMTFTRLQIGTYHYYVNNFSQTFGPGMTGSPARVELNVNGNASLYSPPVNEGTNLWWHVFDLTVDASCNITVTPVGTWGSSEPTYPSASVTYCGWVDSGASGGSGSSSGSTSSGPFLGNKWGYGG